MISRVLIVDDDPIQRKILGRFLRRELDFDSCEAEHGRAALDLLEADRDGAIKIIILDLSMPVMDGLETLEILAQKFPSLPVIMMTGTNDVNSVVASMKLGAVDFLTKPFESERMLITVKNALKISALTREVSRLKSEQEGRFSFDNLIGHERGLLSVTLLGRKAAPSDLPVLISGETGTGKEVFAKAIHGESKRAGKPFIAVNCGAIPAQLVESTLFGHEKGAFTGATEKTTGKFREADGGTIFLDEVGELPLEAQVKLLRVLQQKEVEPVGAGRPVPVSVRVISATNLDLEEEVKRGRFREDLFFRLNVMQIEMPPLRARKEDIPALAAHFIERYASKEGTLPRALSDDAQDTLQAYEWPGNVRQLENMISRAMVMSDRQILEKQDFAALLSGQNIPQQARTSLPPISTPQDLSLLHEDGSSKTLDQIELEVIQKALERCGQNVTQAAKSIGLAKSTFYKKMKS